MRLFLMTFFFILMIKMDNIVITHLGGYGKDLVSATEAVVLTISLLVGGILAIAQDIKELNRSND